MDIVIAMIFVVVGIATIAIRSRRRLRSSS